MSDFHSPAYYIAGRSVLAFKSGEVSDLTVEDPDAVLADVSKDIERAFSEFPTAETSQQQRDACMAVLVGAMSQRQGAALSAEWNAVTTPLFQLLMAAHRMNRESRQFVIDGLGSNGWRARWRARESCQRRRCAGYSTRSRNGTLPNSNLP